MFKYLHCWAGGWKLFSETLAINGLTNLLVTGVVHLKLWIYNDTLITHNGMDLHPLKPIKMHPVTVCTVTGHGNMATGPDPETTDMPGITHFIISYQCPVTECPPSQFPSQDPYINIAFYWYRNFIRKSHYGDKRVIRLCYLHNGDSHTGKMASLYWISPLNS